MLNLSTDLVTFSLGLSKLQEIFEHSTNTASEPLTFLRSDNARMVWLKQLSTVPWRLRAMLNSIDYPTVDDNFSVPEHPVWGVFMFSSPEQVSN